MTSPDSTAGHLEQVIALLAGEWQRAASYLPVLDHNRGEGGTESAAADTATVLASQPHPARLFVRRLDSFPDLSGLSELLTPQWFYLNVVLGGIDPALNPQIESPYVEIGRLYEAATANQEIDSVDTQISVWRSVSTGIRGYLESLGLGHHVDTAIDWIAAVISILSSYEQRHHPVRWLDLATFAGVLGETATALVEGVLWASSTEWDPDGLIEAPGAPAGHTAAEYLTELATRFRQRDVEGMLAPTSLTDAFLTRQPLLYQLLDRTLHLVPRQGAEEQAVANALELLATVPVDDLDWLLRETLGLGMHRLDAWRTSLATERLQRLRRNRPEGIQIGAFGWVQDLAPRKAPRRSAGYLHAPSLSQAATAAILRSGWLAHGSDDPLSPVAVDLRSARVRTAAWLLDGIRAGQDLGDLLGYRFERALHDRHADGQIRPVRAAVLAASGQPDTPADSPVDGIALLELARAGGLGLTAPAVADAIADIEGAFDAVNDASLAEAVHQLATGNYGRATAMLDAMAGTHSPPELLGARTARDGISVEHRVLILLAPDSQPPAERGWQPGIRDRLAPALEAWVASVLPAATAVALPSGLTLADLRLSALDALYLAGDDPGQLSAPLSTLASTATGGGGRADVPYADFALAAIELRRAFESLRVADARDLLPAHDPGESGLDTSTTLEAARDLIASFSAAAQNSSPQALARFGVSVEEAPHRMHLVEAAEDTEKKLAALFMARLPLLGRFTMPATDFSVPVAEPGEVDDWCDAMARVRPAIGRLFTAGMAAELCAGDSGLSAVATQLPLVAGQPWAALHRPQTPHGNMSLVAVTGPGGPPAPGRPACGLVVDQWAERIPHPEQITGVAVQHDAPTNRPPQVWLLAVTPDEEKWSLQLVLDTLLETLDHAAQRAVGTEDLLDHGRAIPAVFVPGNIANWPAGTGEAS